MVYRIPFCGQHCWMGEKVVMCSKKTNVPGGKGDNKIETDLVGLEPAEALSSQRHHKGSELLPFPDRCVSPAGLWCWQPAPSPVRGVWEWYSFKDPASPSLERSCADCITFKTHFITGHILSFLIFSYLPINHSNEKWKAIYHAQLQCLLPAAQTQRHLVIFTHFS